MNQLEIRPGILRTPDSCFAGLPDYSFAPHYVEIADRALGPLRMHYVAEGAAAAAPAAGATAAEPEVIKKGKTDEAKADEKKK